MQEKTFTLKQAIEIQDTHLNEWKKILNRKSFERLYKNHRCNIGELCN